jgi:hypothetical protein
MDPLRVPIFRPPPKPEYLDESISLREKIYEIKRYDSDIDSDLDSVDSEKKEPLTLFTAKTWGQLIYVLLRDQIIWPWIQGFGWGLAANIYRWLFTRWWLRRGGEGTRRERIGQHIARRATGTGLGIGLGVLQS